MAPRNKRPRAGLRRIDAALDAMRPLGFPADLVRKSVKELLKVYGNEGWTFIEDGSYRVLIDVMLNEQKEPDHEHHPEEKLVHESYDLQANTETSEAGQCGKMVCEDHDVDESINGLGVADKQMENQGKDQDQTISVEISSIATDDTQQQQHQGQFHFGFAPTSSLPQTDSVSSKRKCKPCYGWISDDDEDDEEDNVGNTNITQ